LLLHFPSGALSVGNALGAKEFGVPALTSALAFFLASLFQAAESSLTTWQSWFDLLKLEASQRLPFEQA